MFARLSPGAGLAEQVPGPRRRTSTIPEWLRPAREQGVPAAAVSQSRPCPTALGLPQPHGCPLPQKWSFLRQPERYRPPLQLRLTSSARSPGWVRLQLRPCFRQENSEACLARDSFLCFHPSRPTWCGHLCRPNILSRPPNSAQGTGGTSIHPGNPGSGRPHVSRPWAAPKVPESYTSGASSSAPIVRFRTGSGG